MSELKPIGKTARGLAVYPVTHPSYRHLEHTQAVGAEPPHLAKLAQAAHPHYRAVDHEEASVMHHARRNMQAARAHEAASQAMSKSLSDDMLLPASDSSLAWVYEGATPAMTPDDAATAIRAATIGWTQDDHLQMGALQHHLAVALCDDPERQAVCSAAAYMHVAAAGLNPGSLLGKSLDPKVLRPKLGTKPVRIGTTRSNKPIYNMFDHPAHASFKTADHVDHIKAMEAHNKEKKMNKSGGEGSRDGKVIGHTNGKPIYESSHASYDKGFKATHPQGGDKQTHFDNADHVLNHDAFAEHSAGDHAAIAAHFRAKAQSLNGKKGALQAHNIATAHSLASRHLMSLGESKNAKIENKKSMNKSAAFREKKQEVVMHKSEAVSILENFLAKSSASVLGRTSSGKAVHPASHSSYGKVHALKTMASGPKKRVGVQDAIRSTLRAHGAYTAKDHAEAGALHEKAGNIHLAEMHNMASGFLGASKKSMSKSGEGSRGGKVIGHTSGGRPIYGPTADIHSGIVGTVRAETNKKSKHRHDNVIKVHARHAGHYSMHDHQDAANAHKNQIDFLQGKPGTNRLISKHQSLAEAHYVVAQAMKRGMLKSDTTAMAVNLDESMQGSPIDGSYVDAMGGSHDLFMQQAEIANSPTMWAPIATVPEN